MIIIYKNGNKNSVNLYPSLMDILTYHQRQLDEALFKIEEKINNKKLSWYERQDSLALKEFLKDSSDRILIGRRF